MKSDLFVKNWNYSETKMPQIVEILRHNAMHIVSIAIAEPDEDMKQSTDLKITVTGGDVAARVRRGNTTFRDLTIRAYNKGWRTEIDKLRDGYARWYLYAWEGDGGKFCDWILVDIDVMRNRGLLSGNRKVIMNKDGVTGFVSYGIAELEDSGALVARKGKE